MRLLDTENIREQEALGIIGVNLIYGAFHYHTAPSTLIASLMDGLTCERIEVDMIKFSGPCFAGVDNRLMSLQLVEQGFTDATMCSPKSRVGILLGRQWFQQRWPSESSSTNSSR